jgi:hypothetical protein
LRHAGEDSSRRARRGKRTKVEAFGIGNSSKSGKKAQKLRRSTAAIGSAEEIWTIESFYVQGAAGECTGEEEIVSHQILLRLEAARGLNPRKHRRKISKRGRAIGISDNQDIGDLDDKRSGHFIVKILN